MTGTALTTATVGEREQDATTKETGTDPPDRGDLSVMAIMGGETAPTLPANSLRPSQQSRKVVAALVGATIIMALGGSKVRQVQEVVVADHRKGIGSTKIRSGPVSW